MKLSFTKLLASISAALKGKHHSDSLPFIQESLDTDTEALKADEKRVAKGLYTQGSSFSKAE